MISVLRKLIGLFDRRTRLQFAVLLLPMLVAATLEMLSIGAVLPVLQVTTGGGGRLTTLATQFWPDVPQARLVAYLGGIFVALFVVKNIGLLGVTWFINWFSDRKRAQFATALFRTYLNKPYVFYLGRNTADILRELTQSVPLVFESLSLMMAAVLEIFLVIATAALLMLIEPRLTLAAAVLLLMVGVAFNFGTQRQFSQWGQRVHVVDGQAIKTVVESFGAIRDIKVLNCEERQVAQFSRALYELAHYRTLVMTAPHAPRLLVETVMVVGMVVILPALMAHHPVADLVSILGVFAMAALRLLPSMNRILVATTELRHRAARIEAIHKDMQASSVIVQQQIRLSPPPAQAGADPSCPAFPFTREIRFENVGFVYPGRSRPALSNVDLVVPWGESVGMVGTSGAGKSTAIDILIGLLAPSSGRILVDGQDIADHLSEWQGKIGHVPQHIYLLDDTLRNNIVFGHDRVDEESLAEAVRLSCLEEVIAVLPQGLDTMVGENGYGLSGGQRQRVGIARALYRQPDLLVFDEATSALDNETERDVTAAIERLRGMKTMVIVAHRLETIRKCAKIAFFKDGRLLAANTFDALARENPQFRLFAGLDPTRDAAAL